MTTDEEDNQQKQSFNSTPDQTRNKQQTISSTTQQVCFLFLIFFYLSTNTNGGRMVFFFSFQNLTPNSSIRSKSSEKQDLDDQSSISSHCDHLTDDENDLIPIGEEANTNTLIRQPQMNNNDEQHSGYKSFIETKSSIWFVLNEFRNEIFISMSMSKSFVNTINRSNLFHVCSTSFRLYSRRR